MTQLKRALAVLGPLISFSFLFMCLFFMLNAFLAVIMTTYDEVCAAPTQTQTFKFNLTCVLSKHELT